MQNESVEFIFKKKMTKKKVILDAIYKNDYEFIVALLTKTLSERKFRELNRVLTYIIKSLIKEFMEIYDYEMYMSSDDTKIILFKQDKIELYVAYKHARLIYVKLVCDDKEIRVYLNKKIVEIDSALSFNTIYTTVAKLFVLIVFVMFDMYDISYKSLFTYVQFTLDLYLSSL